jgi:hypothetical protein
VPDVNGAWMDTFVRRYEQVDINLIMGTGQGLLTPLVRYVPPVSTTLLTLLRLCIYPLNDSFTPLYLSFNDLYTPY